MLKFDLLNNAGIQSGKKAESKVTENAFEIAKSKPTKKPLAKKSNVSDENKKRLKAAESELNTKVKKDKSKKNVNLFPVFLFIIIVAIIGYGGFYLYSNPSTITMAKNKIIQLLPDKKTIQVRKPKNEPVPKNLKQQAVDVETVSVSNEVSALIEKSSLNLGLITGLMELVPNDAILYDFYAKDGNLSLICIVNDIISGENMKFYVYNHKLDMKPELFYIEKTENDNKYQITGLVNLLNKDEDVTEHVHQKDSELYYSLNSIAQSYNINIKPLTISKRDQTQIRDAHIVLSGSMNQMISFIRKLSVENLNVAVKSFEFVGLDAHKSVTDLELKIDLIIYPQSL